MDDMASDIAKDTDIFITQGYSKILSLWWRTHTQGQVIL